MKIIEWWSKTKNTNFGTFLYILSGFLIALGTNTILGLSFQTDTPVVAVFSNSMVPEFYQGDILFIRNNFQGEEYKIGDIIVFNSNSYHYPIIHRIIQINNDGTYETMGDANPGQGEFEHNILINNIHGKAILKVPALGWIKIGAENSKNAVFDFLGII